MILPVVSTLRELLTRFFGSDEVELTISTPTSATTPAPEAEAQPATHPAGAPVAHNAAGERRGAVPLVLRPASRAE